MVRRAPFPRWAQVLPSFLAVGAPSVVDPQGPDVLGDGTPNTVLLVGADLQGTQENPPPQQQGPGGSGSGYTVQGTEAQEHRGTGRAAVRQGADRPREPTLHEALSSIMGAYHHSQETMATVLAKFQETQRLQEEQYMGFREKLRTISFTLGTIVGVLKEVLNTRRDTVALQGAPDTIMDDELPTTSTNASGKDALPQDHHTSTPPPAEREPPRKQSLRSRNKTEHDAKTPAKK
ncbi:hypothetical protein NDU88_008081 [Pleurodeles waltl]|uniref:Uncharacterized protein n=1 Tax=Pleurodeles waltl TaxID=8319 RepID=A0AAV7RUM4_PLEWA|nr:hypothetical protein NDU88_008081 [Pleurodeles waltl]